MQRLRPLIVGGLLITAVIPCFAFALAGIAKLHAPFMPAVFLSKSLNFSLGDAFLAIRVLAIAELTLAVLVALSISKTQIPAYSGMCLLAFFAGLLLRVIYTSPSASTCGCFGSLMGERLSGNLWLQASIAFALFVLLGMHAGFSYFLRRTAPFSAGRSRGSSGVARQLAADGSDAL